MICSKCKNKAIAGVEYAGKLYCKKHFAELMEKRVRKNLRTRELIDVRKEYVLVDDNSCEAKLTEFFLNKIFKGYLKINILQLNKGKMPSRIKDSEIIFPTNLDEQVLIFLDEFMSDNAKAKNQGGIVPLEVLKQDEIEILCGIYNIPYSSRVKNNKIDDLEKKHPGTKFSLMQSRMNLEKTRQKKQ